MKYGNTHHFTTAGMLIILSLFLSFQSVWAQNLIISDDIITGFDSEDALPCMIVMQNQWQAPPFIKNWSKEAKGDFVFDNLRAFAQKDQKSVITYCEEEHIDYQSFYIFNGLRAVINREQLRSIQQIPGIKSILLDQSTQLQIVDKRGQTTERVDIEWGVARIQADKVWDLGFLGNGVVVAGQDTGYDFENPYISDNYRGSNAGSYDHNYNWHDAIHSLNPQNEDPDDNPDNNPCGLDSEFPCDDNNHGTHTMGTMVGDNPEDKIGVAPEANWIACRNMDRGWGSPSTYTECFEWFLAPTALDGSLPDPARAPHVITNSWRCPEVEGCNSTNWVFMETVVNNLVAAGIVVVASAGNDGTAGCSSINSPPSMFEQAFVVGASNMVDSVAPFSSYGPIVVDGSGRWKPDVIAPGVDVRSITLNGFGIFSGTSMSGPHVTGAVALMISANPALAGQVEVIQNILKETAVPVKDPRSCDQIVADEVPNFIAGYGRIDVLAAVNEATIWTNIVEQNKLSFHIYPNPSTDFVALVLEEEPTTLTVIQAYNMLGEMMWESELQSKNISVDVRSWAPGAYSFVYRADGKIQEHIQFVKL